MAISLCVNAIREPMIRWLMMPGEHVSVFASAAVRAVEGGGQMHMAERHFNYRILHQMNQGRHCCPALLVAGSPVVRRTAKTPV